MSVERKLENNAKKNLPLQYPESIISSRNSDQTIVTDVLITQGTIFGPFPGNDAVEDEYNNWMEYASCVKDFAESNLLIGFCNDQLYFQAHRFLPAGTELLVWAGNKDTHSTDFAEWNNCNDKSKKKKLTFTCQDCDFYTDSMYKLMFHCNNLHKLRKGPTNKRKCLYCPHIASATNNLRQHILRIHGLYLKDGQVKIPIKRKQETEGEAHISTQQDPNTIAEAQINPSTAPAVEHSSSPNKNVTNGNEKRIYKCKSCEATFVFARQLYGHMSSHKKAKCKYKQKGKTRINSLKWKLNKMTTAKNYSCGVCGKKFGAKGSKYKHMQSFHSGIYYVCSACKRPFNRKDKLLNHIKVIHKSKADVIEEKKSSSV